MTPAFLNIGIFVMALVIGFLGIFVVAVTLGLMTFFMHLTTALADRRALSRRLQKIKEMDTGRWHGRVNDDR